MIGNCAPDRRFSHGRTPSDDAKLSGFKTTFQVIKASDPRLQNHRVPAALAPFVDYLCASLDLEF